MWVTDEVGGDNIILSVVEDSLMKEKISIKGIVIWVIRTNLEWSLRSLLESGLDFIVRSRFLKSSDKIDNGNVAGGHPEGHTSELAIQAWDNLSDGFGSTSGTGDDVGGSTTTATPVLGGRTINCLLSGGGSVDSGHQTLDNTELVVDNLGKRGKAVGGARSVGNNVVFAVILVEIDTADEHGSICGWGGDDDFLGATFQVGRSLFDGSEDTLYRFKSDRDALRVDAKHVRNTHSGFNNIVNALLTPRNVGGVPFGEDRDLLAIDYELAVLNLDGSLEATVGRVVFEHVCLEPQTERRTCIRRPNLTDHEYNSVLTM